MEMFKDTTGTQALTKLIAAALALALIAEWVL